VVVQSELQRLARAAGERIESEAVAMSLIAICTTVGTTRHDATKRDRVVTAVKRASPQNNVFTDARRVDRHERVARGAYLASAAYLCT